LVNPYKSKPKKRSFFPQLDNNVAVDSKFVVDKVVLEMTETNVLQPIKRGTVEISNKPVDVCDETDQRTTVDLQPDRATLVEDLSNDTTLCCYVKHASSSAENSEHGSESVVLVSSAAQGMPDNAVSTDNVESGRSGAQVVEEATFPCPSALILEAEEKPADPINSSSDEITKHNEDNVGSGVFHDRKGVDAAKDSPVASDLENFSDVERGRNCTANATEGIDSGTSMDYPSQKIHTSFTHTDSLSNPTVIADVDLLDLASREEDIQNVVDENNEPEEIARETTSPMQHDEQLAEKSRKDIDTVHADSKPDGKEEALVVSPAQTNRKGKWIGDSSWMELEAEYEVPKPRRSPQIDSQGIDLSILSQLPLALRSEARLAHFLGTESSDPVKKRKGTLHKWMVDSSSIQKVSRVSLSPQRTKLAKRNKPVTGIATFFPSKSGNY
jgi:hypothetical protein